MPAEDKIHDAVKAELQKRITAFNRAARYWFADVPGQLNGLRDAYSATLTT